MATGTLTSTTIAARYKSLLKLTGTANDVLAADASAKIVEDGDGNDSVLSLSTTRVGIGNTAPTALLTAGAIVTLVTDGTTAVTPEGVNVHITEASKYAMGIKNADASGDGLIIQAGDAADDFALRVEDYDSATDLFVVQGIPMVGIGTATPGTVNGNDHTQGSTGGLVHLKGNLPRIIFDDDGDTPQWAIEGQDYWAVAELNDGSTAETSIFRVDTNSKISLSNNDGGNDYNTVFGYSAFNTSTNNASDKNVAIGNLAMGTGTVAGAVDNTAVGYRALTDITSGDGNNAIGMDSLTSITIGRYNQGIGANALKTETIGDGTIAIGESAGYSQLSDSNNETTGNTIVGLSAAYYNVTGTNNTYIGSKTGFGASGQSNSHNTGIGKGAMLAITTGAANTVVGGDAGAALTDGHDNVMIGHDAAGVTTTVGYGVFIGRSVASGLMTAAADGTVAIGFNALDALTSGTTNTAVGHQTGLLCTTASDNTYIGHTVGVATHVDDFGTTAVGSGAYSGTHTGSVNQYNTAIGYNSMDAAMNGALKNTAVGAGALGAITTGVQNVAIGYDAGNDIVTGNNNVMLGHQAGDKSSNVDNAVIIGSDAGADNMTAAADGSIGIGASALTALTTGASNLAIGYAALASNIDGDNNTAIGWQALQTFEAASDGDGHNVAVGLNALQALTNGQYNTVVGTLAGDELTTGAYNVLVGYQAMHNADGSESENTCLGYQAGTNVDGGSGNVFIGSNSTASTAAASNQTVVGKDAEGQADNSVVLGNAAVDRVYMSQDGAAVMYANGTINTSDVRFKENVEDTDLGLEFINKVRPVKYDYKKDKQDGKKRYGIIAQEVLEILKNSGNEDFAGIKTNDPDKLGADYIQFLAPLIKAIQELSAKVKALEDA